MVRRAFVPLFLQREEVYKGNTCIVTGRQERAASERDMLVKSDTWLDTEGQSWDESGLKAGCKCICYFWFCRML